MGNRSYIPDSKVALVCSARSSHTKALGTTNLLLRASREALQPSASSSRQNGSSGRETPFFPKRVGSGFFGRERESSLGKDRERDMSNSMMSSLSSLNQLDNRSGSPSPFQASNGRSRSPTSPTISGLNGFGGCDSSAFQETVELIKKGHLEAAWSAVRPGPIRDELEEEIQRDATSLRNFLFAAQVGAPVQGWDG